MLIIGEVKAMSQTLQLPSHLVERLAEVCIEFEDLHDDLEDFLISRNPRSLRKLRKARREDLAGKTRPYDQLGGLVITESFSGQITETAHSPYTLSDIGA